MTFKINFFSTAVIIIGLLIFIGSSCKKIENPYEGKEGKDTLLYDHINTRIFVEITDAKTKEYLSSNQGEMLRVLIRGLSKDAVFDIIGKQLEVYNPRNGFLSFGLLPDITPSASAPVSFSLSCSLFEYLTISREVNITSPGDYYIKIAMVNINNPPDGIIIEQRNGVGNLYNGTLYEDVTISTGSEEALAIIKGGTKLLTKDSIPLAGKLNITLIYRDLNYDASFNTMQSGISSSILNNGFRQNVVFSPGALADLRITDSDWNEAGIIEEKPIELSFRINNSASNPETGSPYKKGDLIGLFVYDSDTASWIHQKTDTITIGFMSHYYVTTTTPNLSSFCLSNFNIISCNSSTSFNITGDCESCYSVLLNGIMRKSNDNTFIGEIAIPASRDMDNRGPILTGDLPVDIYWSNDQDSSGCIVNPISNPTHIESMCGQSSINLPLSENFPGLISVSASFQGYCPGDSNYLILPSFGLWIRHQNETNWQWVSMTNGKANLCNLYPNESYVLGTVYNNIWQQWEFTVNNEEDYTFVLEFSDSVCRNVFGIL